MKIILREVPAITGNNEKDIKNLRNYIFILREQLCAALKMLQ